MDFNLSFETPERRQSFLLRATKRHGIRVEAYTAHDRFDPTAEGAIPVRVFNGHSLHTTVGRTVSYLVEVYGAGRTFDLTEPP